MGTGITTQVQVLKNDEWVNSYEAIFQRHYGQSYEPFSEQNYGLFGFLAGVSNYALVPILSEPRGFPESEVPDFGKGLGAAHLRSEWEPWPQHRDNYSPTWFLVSELIAYDYDTVFENRRNERDSVPVGSGEMITVREYIGPKFFEELSVLEKLGDPEKTRVVMSFYS